MNKSNPHSPLVGINSRSGSCFTMKSKFLRFIWAIVYLFLFKPSPRFCHSWRRFLLRFFGANISGPSRVYSGARVWIPSNLTINGRSSVADGAYIYNIAPVVIGNNVVISQGSYLCTGTHDYNSQNFELLCAPIVIHDEAWLAANCFVHPGVTIGEGAVLGACSVWVSS